MRKRKSGKVRAFFVGFIAFWVFGLLASLAVGLIIGLFRGSADDGFVDNGLAPVRPLVFLVSIAVAVQAGQSYLRRYHPEPVSPPVHTGEGQPAMSQLAHDDLRRVRDTALRMAESILRQQGELVPQAVIVSSDGKASARAPRPCSSSPTAPRNERSLLEILKSAPAEPVDSGRGRHRVRRPCRVSECSCPDSSCSRSPWGSSWRPFRPRR